MMMTKNWQPSEDCHPPFWLILTEESDQELDEKCAQSGGLGLEMAGSDQDLSTEPHWCGMPPFPSHSHPSLSLPFWCLGVECHILSVATSQGIVSTTSLHGTILFPGFHFQNSNTSQNIIQLYHQKYGKETTFCPENKMNVFRFQKENDM